MKPGDAPCFSTGFYSVFGLRPAPSPQWATRGTMKRFIVSSLVLIIAKKRDLSSILDKIKLFSQIASKIKIQCKTSLAIKI